MGKLRLVGLAGLLAVFMAVPAFAGELVSGEQFSQAEAQRLSVLSEKRLAVAEAEDFSIPEAPSEIDWSDFEAGVDYVRNQLIIGFFPEVSFEDALSFIDSKGWQIVSIIVWDGSSESGDKAICVQFDDGCSIDTALAEANLSDLVLFSEVNGIAYSTDVSDISDLDAVDPDETWAIDAVKAKDAWDVSQTAGRVSVAVLDSGIQLDHPDLKNNIDFANAWDFVDGCALTGDVHGHGTAVAGVVSAQAKNGFGADGISGNANIVPIRVATVSDGRCWANWQTVAEAIYKIIDNPNIENLKVVNISYSGTNPTNTAILQRAINKAYEKGVLVVVSAGNSGKEAGAADLLEYPADLNNVIAVIGTDQNNQRCSFSSFGAGKDISAPGIAVRSTMINSDYGYNNGTSFAAPLVAGTLALMYACDPEMTAEEAEHVIESTAVDLGAPGFDSEYGWGLLDAHAAVLSLVDTNKVSLGEVSISGVGSTYYTGGIFAPEPVLTYEGATLVKGLDYEVFYQYGSAIGDVRQVTIVGKGGYYGAVGIPCSIMSRWPRVYGDDYFDTMRQVVDRVYGENTCDTVFVAADSGYIDALSANGLAGLSGSPVLMCGKEALSSETKEAINSLKAKKVYIIGGASVISSGVEDEIAALESVQSVERIAGTEAADTANELYKKGKSLSLWGHTAIVATQVDFKDALSASPYSYAEHAPVFLVNNDGVLDSGTAALIKNGGFAKVVLLGGNAVVKESVVDQLEGVQTIRLAGTEAVDTSIAIAGYSLANGLSANQMAVATSESYYDALSGVVLCGTNKAPMLLFNVSETEKITSFIRLHKSSIEHGYVLGGPAVVSAATVEVLENAML